ncbi:MAG: hypothetical protein SVN78_09375 [Deferribacterota bacterium]|nr:hypothetical protein [Deferribacterota bacterium]
MKKLIILCLIMAFGFFTNVFATDGSLFAASQTSKDESSVFTVTHKDVTSALKQVLSDVEQSGYSTEKVAYALDAVKFTMQIDLSSITSLIQPIIGLLEGFISDPVGTINSLIPMLQGIVQSLLSGQIPMSQGDVIMLKELNFALNDAIQSGYNREKVTYAINVFEKVLTQSNLSLDTLAQLITPIIDELRTLVTTLPAIIPNIVNMLSSVVSNMASIAGEFRGIGG